MPDALQSSHVPTSWELEEGDEIAPGRTALKRLGGGRRYDAYLAFDDHLHAVVVAKVVRPHLVGGRAHAPRASARSGRCSPGSAIR